MISKHLEAATATVDVNASDSAAGSGDDHLDDFTVKQNPFARCGDHADSERTAHETKRNVGQNESQPVVTANACMVWSIDLSQAFSSLESASANSLSRRS